MWCWGSSGRRGKGRRGKGRRGKGRRNERGILDLHHLEYA
jgi:hypothetical protein